jgi:hypothetical protein
MVSATGRRPELSRRLQRLANEGGGTLFEDDVMGNGISQLVIAIILV